MKKTKPLILITNDDGISAPGIRALTNRCDVRYWRGSCSRSDKPQSAMGHTI
jgi:5'-nucleotidase